MHIAFAPERALAQRLVEAAARRDLEPTRADAFAQAEAVRVERRKSEGDRGEEGGYIASQEEQKSASSKDAMGNRESGG